MAIIKGKEVNAVKHDGKIFVLECHCNRTEGHPWSLDKEKYGVRADSSFLGIKCVCGYYPWIILPEKKAEAPK